jgi:hypothetical protein
MDKQQKHRYEMFVRVRDFGAANSALFPSSSTGGRAFARVTAAVAEIEGHLKNRVVARAEARKIKTTTRAAVASYMKAIAATGRRAARQDERAHAFRLPDMRSAEELIAAARVMADDARTREAEFVRLGLPATFISDFETLVNTLGQAVNTRMNSVHQRRWAQAGLASAFAQGLEDIRELDVVVPNALRDDTARLAQWQRARHIDGQSSSTRPHAAAALPAAVPPEPSSVDPPSAGETMPAAVEQREEVAVASREDAALAKAS